MANGYKNFVKGVGIVPNGSSQNTTLGDLEVLSDDRLHFYGASNDAVTTDAVTATFTNKSIDGTTNTLTNIPSGALPSNTATTNTTQTFTNKSIDGGTNTLTNIPFSALPVNTATTNTSQTFTNKTIDGGSNTLTNISSGSIVATLTGKTLTGTNGITFSSASTLVFTNNSQTVSVSASPTASASYGFTFPDASPGASTALIYDGSNYTWATLPSSNLAVTTKTSTYAIQGSDEVVLCSGSAFTVTLPTAVGVIGKQYTIKKTDASLANQITIATTSSQTIDGVTTRKLSTLNELFSIFSDGANWQVLEHSYSTKWNQSLTVSMDGVTSASSTSFWTRREGGNLQIRGVILPSVTTATTCALSLPVTIDSTQLPTNANGTVLGFMEQMQAGASVLDFSVGNTSIGNTPALGATLIGVWYDGSTTSKLFVSRSNGSGSMTKESANSFINTGGSTMSFWGISIPVSGWES